MIRITILTGPRSGQSRTSDEVRKAGATPLDLLTELARQGWRWEVKVPSASADEALEWAQADLVGRILLAAIQERAVRFMGRRWDFSGLEFASTEAGTMIGEIEDAVAGSGRMVRVLTDDDEGDLVIGISGYEA